MNKSSPQAAGLLRHSLYLLLLAVTTAATADDAALYGPEAPPGSAFIRIFNATPTTIGDASVAGKPFRKLAQYEASDFQFVANGSYVLKIGEATEQVPMRAGKYYTATVDSHGIKVHELTPPENRLKALVMVFNLTGRPGIALKTQDGEQIITKAGIGEFGRRAVNAVRVEMALYDAGQKLADTRPINFSRGRAYNLFVTEGQGAPKLTWVID